jgi:hypothetical protein
MTAPALGAGTTRRRVLFGLLDADSWSWASIKALFWFVVIIMLLGYIPDRAYYFTVFSTIDLGINVVSPVNLCPPENKNLPCPVPAGAALPWEPSPPELGLPAPRTDGSAVQSGSNFLYIGGSDGSAAQADVYVAPTAALGNFGPWGAAPSLPEPRAKASVIFSAGTIYVFGGLDANGQATTTAWSMTPDAATGQLAEWAPAEGLDLPEPRAGASVIALADGLLLLGGVDASGAATNTVWKSTTASNGDHGAWEPLPAMPEARADAEAAIIGSHIFVFGGSNGSQATSVVLRGSFPEGESDGHGGTIPPADPNAISWAAGTGSTNLPAPRTDASGWIANGVLYLVGGSDGAGVQNELYWTVPDAQGNILEWKHLEQSDLPEPGLGGSAPLVSGANAFIIGGTTGQQVINGAARTNLAPQPPFFQLGVLGATIPALKIEGEVGQQLGYLAAAGVGTGNFILLIVIGWAYAHPAKVRELWNRIRRRPRSA